MTHGIVCTNDAGQIQFNTEFPNLCYVAKGTISSLTVDTWATGNKIKYGTFTYSGGSTPIIVLRIPSSASGKLVGGVVKASVSLGVTTFTVAIAGDDVPSISSIDWYIFDRLTAIDPHGIACWDAAGALTFASGSELILIKDALQLASAPLVLPSGANTSFPTGNTYGMSGMCTFTVRDEGPILGPALWKGYIIGGENRPGGGQISAVANCTTTGISTIFPPAGSIFDGAANVGGSSQLIVDVTGL